MLARTYEDQCLIFLKMVPCLRLVSLEGGVWWIFFFRIKLVEKLLGTLFFRKLSPSFQHFWCRWCRWNIDFIYNQSFQTMLVWESISLVYFPVYGVENERMLEKTKIFSHWLTLITMNFEKSMLWSLSIVSNKFIKNIAFPNRHQYSPVWPY